MRYLLAFFLLILVMADNAGLELSLAPGISVKNLAVYGVIMALVVRATLGEKFAIELPGLQGTFAFYFCYATVTFVIAVLIMHYPKYDLLGSGVGLKNGLLDKMLFFTCFFYAVKPTRDAMFVLRAMLAIVALANAVTVLDASNITHFGFATQRHNGRIDGGLGEANQIASFVIIFIPAYFAQAFTTRGLIRWFWLGGGLVTVVELLMTSSRGGVAGLLLALVAAVWMFRRYLRAGAMVKWAVVGALAMVVMAGTLLSTSYGETFRERFVEQSKDSDAEGLTSGRSLIWAHTVKVMANRPWSLATGFGWGTYMAMQASQNYAYATHNYYLFNWFELGIPGVTCLVLLFYFAVRAARDSVFVATPEMRPHLIAATIGILALAISVFFVNIFTPWTYLWAYAGVTLRLAVNELKTASATFRPDRLIRPNVIQADQGRDMFGWVAKPPR